MFFIDEMKNMTLYKKPFFLPINEENKRKGAATFLLTPDYNSSNKVMNLPYIIKRYYSGYYIEKDITYYINQENAWERPYEDHMVLNESDKLNDKGEKVPDKCTECGSDIKVFLKGEPVYLCSKCNKYYGTVPFKKESADILNEDKLSTKERNELKDSDFGLPEQRKFPMHDKAHVIAAIQYFNTVDNINDEAELAKNIIKKMKKFSMSADDIIFGKNNKIRKYIDDNGEYKGPVNERGDN